ncbi:MAG: PDZ domain-containing protein [Lachnospiraceae bacterium]|nr:PDZ domain-containing protein [Lachnospiraceae bacterium]
MDEMERNELEEDIRSENEQSVSSSEQNFEFITETIKERPINKRRMLLKALFTCILALMFGVIACFTFVSLYPVFSEWLHPVDNTKVVRLEPYEEEVEVMEKPEAGKSGEDAADKDNVSDIADTNSDKEPAGDDMSGDDVPSDDAGTDEDKEGTEDPDEDKKPEIITQVVETVEKDLELGDYSKLYEQIGEVAKEAGRAMVTVTGVSSDTDWFMNVYENRHTCAGLIVAENGMEMLILTRTSVISSSDHITVTFCNGDKYDAMLKKSDPNIDMSILAVPLSKISDETNEACKLAELGTTNSPYIDGMPVIAIGDPLGESGSMAMGQITSHNSVKDMTDTNVSLLTTDIYGSSNASGVIINLSGRVLGIITQDGASPDAKNLIRGYAISDLRDKLEKLSNGQELAYLGIIGKDVPEEATEVYGVPQGAYVRQVVIDSPAMEAGIQNGDVIVKLGTTDITSFSDYKDAMLKCQPNDLMMVTVKRLGRDEYVELSYEISLGKLTK